MIFKRLNYIPGVLLSILLCCLVLMLCGCSSGSSSEQSSEIIPITPDDKIQEKRVETQGIASEQNEAVPYYAQQRLRFFTRDGVVKFYALNRRVPVSFAEYIESGFPMIIPSDYVTSEPYHLTDELNLEDTTGFTFWSDGQDSCKFTFVIKNKQTNENEATEVDLTGSFDDYRIIDGVPGIFAYRPGKTPGDPIVYFNKLKQDYCLEFFGGYYSLCLNKYRALGKYPNEYPTSLKDIFAGEGTLIKKGWEWSPDPTSKYFFEFGIDPPKMRSYDIWGCKKGHEGKPCRVMVHQIYGRGNRIENLNNINQEYVQGRDWWEFSSVDDIPPDVLVRNKLVSSDAFLDAYYSILN